MDPLTQGALGASLPQSCVDRRHAASAGLMGFLAGMAADLDVLIRSSSDPLLFLEYHRQFTHSLVFIPVGGLLCALLLHSFYGRRRGLAFRQSWLFCTLGYATHALLDACTTYGTMLLWPFSDQRFAWNTISIIDPLFTLPLLAGVLLTARRKRRVFVRVALVWACVYMTLGLWQRNVATDMGYDLAHSRGHIPLRQVARLQVREGPTVAGGIGAGRPRAPGGSFHPCEGGRWSLAGAVRVAIVLTRRTWCFAVP